MDGDDARAHVDPARLKSVRKEPRSKRTGKPARLSDAFARGAALAVTPRELPSVGQVATTTPRCAVLPRFAWKWEPVLVLFSSRGNHPLFAPPFE